VASPLDKNVVYVTGKGGVGRSTVVSALGLAASARGQRTIICEVAEQERLSRVFQREGVGAEETELAENLWAVTIDPQQTLEEWLAKQVGGALVRLLTQSSAFQYFFAAAPGARELATVVRIWELAQPERWKRGAARYDLVIVDAPASGHGLAMLRTPKTFGEIARVGPIHRQAGRVQQFLTDPQRTAYCAVALPEEMPVTETLELDDGLHTHLGRRFETIVVNGVLPRRFQAEDVQRLEAASLNGEPDPGARAAVRAALAEHERAKGQQSQLRRLRRRAQADVVTLPFVFSAELGLPELRSLSRDLDRKL
jgi:anion-transporting  ArsA/GET3 family ATPase